MNKSTQAEGRDGAGAQCRGRKSSSQKWRRFRTGAGTTNAGLSQLRALKRREARRSHCSSSRGGRSKVHSHEDSGQVAAPLFSASMPA